jgi:transcriptional regulator with XRE-family HTH domain
MTSAGRVFDRARRRATRSRAPIGDEIRNARMMAGLSQAAVGSRAHVSQPVVSRLEAGTLASASLDTFVLVGAAVGLDVVIKAYPGPRITRDAAHARKLHDFLAHAQKPLRFSLEVGLPSRDGRVEQRASDAMIFDSDGTTGIELEMGLYDLQAQMRRILLKWRDSGAQRILLLINDTLANRRAITSFPEYFAELPKLKRSEVLRALSQGKRPATGYVLV